ADDFLPFFPTRGVTPSSFCPGLLIFCPFRAKKNYAAIAWLSPRLEFPAERQEGGRGLHPVIH
ncbi:MAG TPA: hypothetical protein VF373_11160, partial [Prolixibacteraceae bacterium]